MGGVLFNLGSVILRALEWIYEVLVLKGPLTWVWRILKLLVYSRTPTKNPYSLYDFGAAMVLVALYSVGMFACVYSLWWASGWIDYGLSAVGVACGYMGNRVFNYLKKQEEVFYNR